MALVLSEMGTIIRTKQTIRKKTRAMSSQALSSARFIIIAPIALIVLILYNKPESLHYMLNSATGQKLLIIGAALYSSGILLIKYFSKMKG